MHKERETAISKQVHMQAQHCTALHIMVNACVIRAEANRVSTLAADTATASEGWFH